MLQYLGTKVFLVASADKQIKLTLRIALLLSRKQGIFPSHTRAGIHRGVGVFGTCFLFFTALFLKLNS